MRVALCAYLHMGVCADNSINCSDDDPILQQLDQSVLRLQPHAQPVLRARLCTGLLCRISYWSHPHWPGKCQPVSLGTHRSTSSGHMWYGSHVLRLILQWVIPNVLQPLMHPVPKCMSFPSPLLVLRALLVVVWAALNTYANMQMTCVMFAACAELWEDLNHCPHIDRPHHCWNSEHCSLWWDPGCAQYQPGDGHRLSPTLRALVCCCQACRTSFDEMDCKLMQHNRWDVDTLFTCCGLMDCHQ